MRSTSGQVEIGRGGGERIDPLSGWVWGEVRERGGGRERDSDTGQGEEGGEVGVPTWVLVGAHGLRVILGARLTLLATQQQKIHHLLLIMSARREEGIHVCMRICICGIHTHIYVHVVF